MASVQYVLQHCSICHQWNLSGIYVLLNLTLSATLSLALKMLRFSNVYIKCSMQKCYWENTEGFFKKGNHAFLSSTASGLKAYFHFPLQFFSINPLLTGSTTWSSRHSSLRPEHQRHVNKVIWQKVQIHKIFSDGELKEKSETMSSRVPAHTHTTRKTSQQGFTWTESARVHYAQILLERSHLDFFPFLTQHKPMASYTSDPLLNRREQQQTQYLGPSCMCL